MTPKRIKFHLQLWDGIWSVPSLMVAFLALGVLLQIIFLNRDDPQGGPGFYDPSFLQSALYASCIQVFINFMVWLGLYFNFRGLKHYHKGHLIWNEQGPSEKIGQPLSKEERKLHDRGWIPRAQVSVNNESKNDFNALSPWQRLAFFFLVFVFLSSEWVAIWLHLQ